MSSTPRQPYSGFDRTGYEVIPKAWEHVSNYQNWIYSVLRPHLGQSVLEIGPGYGPLAPHMLKDGKAYHAIDMDEKVIENLRKNIPVRPEQLIVGDVTLPKWVEHFRKLGVDTVLSANVLEHIEDERPILEASERIAPGGRLVALVPAHPALYGTLDVEVGHFRRYTRKSLTLLLQKAGFNIRHMSYFNASGIPAWFISARVLRLSFQAEQTNRSILFYDRVFVPIARLVDSCLGGRCGLSLIAAARMNAPR